MDQVDFMSSESDSEQKRLNARDLGVEIRFAVESADLVEHYVKDLAP